MSIGTVLGWYAAQRGSANGRVSMSAGDWMGSRTRLLRDTHYALLVGMLTAAKGGQPDVVDDGGSRMRRAPFAVSRAMRTSASAGDWSNIIGGRHGMLLWAAVGGSGWRMWPVGMMPRGIYSCGPKRHIIFRSGNLEQRARRIMKWRSVFVLRGARNRQI